MVLIDGSVHHFGYATKDIAKSEKLFQGLGYYACSDLIEDPKLGVCVKFYSLKNNSVKVELIMPITSGKNPLKPILKQRAGFYHLALVSGNFPKTANSLKLKSISDKMPAIAFEGAEIQFFVSKDMGIIELISYYD
jgi:methylmalonyl-CoA/ethylmalonyl-CoA epimerase